MLYDSLNGKGLEGDRLGRCPEERDGRKSPFVIAK
jgi:hypothetical protein